MWSFLVFFSPLSFLRYDKAIGYLPGTAPKQWVIDHGLKLLKPKSFLSYMFIALDILSHCWNAKILYFTITNLLRFSICLCHMFPNDIDNRCHFSLDQSSTSFSVAVLNIITESTFWEESAYMTSLPGHTQSITDLSQGRAQAKTVPEAMEEHY